MTEETNVVQLFGDKDTPRASINEDVSQSTQDVSESTTNALNKKELEPHESFSSDNVLAALIANKYIDEDEAVKQVWLADIDHDYMGLMNHIYNYIIDLMNQYYTERGLEIIWGGSEINSLQIIEKGSKKVQCEYRVELYMHKNGLTDIHILSQDGIVEMIISENKLAPG